MGLLVYGAKVEHVIGMLYVFALKLLSKAPRIRRMSAGFLELQSTNPQ